METLEKIQAKPTAVSDSSAPTTDSLLAAMQGNTVTAGWDVVNAISVPQVNELFAQQFVYKSYLGNSLPPVNGTVPIIQNISVDFQNLVLGPPLLQFSPTLAPQQAMLYIKFLSGTVNTVQTVTGEDGSEASCLLTSQTVSVADNYWLTGTVPLASIQGDVADGQVMVDIVNATGFSAQLGFSGGAETTLGDYFLTYLQANAENFQYALGTIIYSDNGTNLVPVMFDFATQVDSSDPNDVGRLLLLIATTYHPDGSSQTSLPLPNIVPQGYSTTLLISSQVLFQNFVQPAYQDYFGPKGVSATASQPSAGAAYSITVSGSANLGVVEYDYPPPSSQSNYSGVSSEKEAVMLPLNNLSVTASNNGITAAMNTTWDQGWVLCTVSGKMGATYDNGTISMTATLNDVNYASVNSSTDVVSFAGSVDPSVTFQQSSLLDKLFQGDSADIVAGMVQTNATNFLQGLNQIQIPEINAFAVTNLLFPQQNILQLQSANVPGDLALFGSVQSPDMATAPVVATLSDGQTQQFSASRNGQAYTDVTWTLTPSDLGSVSTSGLYTAPASIVAATEVLVTAVDNTDSSQTFSSMVSLVPGGVLISPYVAVMSPSTQAQQFTAVVAGNQGQGVVWSLEPSGVGSISPTGVYTPPSQVSAPTSVNVVATNGDEQSQALVALFPYPPNSVDISPVLTSLTAGRTCQFSASVVGNSDPDQTFTWTLIPNVGTISADGLYTAPESIAENQTVVVAATSTFAASLFATAAVRLVRPASSGS